MVFRMPAPDLACVHRHRAVEEYWNVRNAPCRLELMKVKHQALGTSHREGWNHDGAAAADRAGDHLGQHILRMPRLVAAVPVG
jgi:hypothetical protein